MLFGETETKKIAICQAWWFRPLTPAIGKLRQDDLPEFDVNLGYRKRPCSVDPCFKNKTNHCLLTSPGHSATEQKLSPGFSLCKTWNSSHHSESASHWGLHSARPLKPSDRNRSLTPGRDLAHSAGVRVQPGPFAPPGWGCRRGAGAAGVRYSPGCGCSRGRCPPVSQRPGRRPLRLSLHSGLTFRLSHGAEPACRTNAPAAIETRWLRELAAPAPPGGSRWLRRKARVVRSDKSGTLGPGFWKARLPVCWGAESSWLSTSCWELLDI